MELTKTASARDVSPFSSLITILYEPARTFAALEPRRAAWLPVILMMLSTAALMSWYFSFVDFSWLTDQMLATVKDAVQREKAQAMMSKQTMLVSGLAGALIAIPVGIAVIAAYFMAAGKLCSKEFSFGKGFALVAWSYVPGLLSLPLGAMQIMLSSSGQMGFSDLNPLSLNTLFFHYLMSHPMASLLDSVSVLSVWSAVLLVIGFQAWAKVSRATALKVVLIPYLVIYGGWLAFALSRAA